MAGPSAPAKVDVSDTSDLGTTFAIEEEDHTLGNTLRYFLNRNPYVTFCGYSVPHPQDSVVNVRVQTTADVSATHAMREACDNVQDVVSVLKDSIAAAVAEYKEAHPPESPPAAMDED